MVSHARRHCRRKVHVIVLVKILEYSVSVRVLKLLLQATSSWSCCDSCSSQGNGILVLSDMCRKVEIRKGVEHPPIMLNYNDSVNDDENADGGFARLRPSRSKRTALANCTTVPWLR